MSVTSFYRFVVTFADAVITPDLLPNVVGHIDRVYRIVESPQHRWTISENEQRVAMTDEQHVRLIHLLTALQPPPDPAIEPMSLGCDGTWSTFVLQRDDQQTSYRWWSRPPPDWDALGAIARYVQHLAEIPREHVAKRQRQVTRQFFDCLAARDLPGMLTYYHPDIEYRNPFFELHGAAQVGAMWRMWWNYLPDLRVVCKDSGVGSGMAYWSAIYTYPPTGRCVEHHISADLGFANDTIIRHVDRFNMHEWAGKAYGFVGGVVGGWRLFERRMAVTARTRLAAYVRAQQRKV